MGSGTPHHRSEVGRVLRASALALMLALAGAGCQTGARSPRPGRGVSTSPQAPTVSAPAPRAVGVGSRRGWNVLCVLRGFSRLPGGACRPRFAAGFTCRISRPGPGALYLRPAARCGR